MDYNIYYGSGSGIDKNALTQLYTILNNFDNNINILEFGSGQSTQFFIDYKLLSKKNIFVDSYDNDPNFAYQNEDNHDFLNLYIKPLISCSEYNFNKKLKEKIYNRNYFSPHQLPPYNDKNFWRQRNCFYDIDNKELKDHYDIILIDGPNGNGRNLAYLHIIDRIKPGSIIFIDDYNNKDNDFDYNFIKNLKYIFNVEEIYSHTNLTNKDTWNTGGNFAIYKLI